MLEETSKKYSFLRFSLETTVTWSWRDRPAIFISAQPIGNRSAWVGVGDDVSNLWNLGKKPFQWAEIFTICYSSVDLCVVKVSGRNMILQFFTIYSATEWDVSETPRTLSRRPMGTYPSGVFYISFGSTSWIDSQFKSDSTVASVLSSVAEWNRRCG